MIQVVILIDKRLLIGEHNFLDPIKNLNSWHCRPVNNNNSTYIHRYEKNLKNFKGEEYFSEKVQVASFNHYNFHSFGSF